MILGMRKQEIQLAEYDPCWAEVFDQTKKEIVKETNLNQYQIEHIGSTAIKGIPAKPIIDILIGINSLRNGSEAVINQLKKADFLKLKVERPDEIVLARFTDDTYEVKTHFIHLVELNAKKWKELIFFRDYLNEHRSDRERYAQLKQQILREQTITIESYTDKKIDFIEDILNKQKNR
ncbi:GrpB family protein [Marinilactibacillus kalidii]|uniref:GrpB family protein n=1 Tax=Marinilactibacillus kalidii TaxID=2820274 RepID=UPI001ABE599F|nr:GrpB family protein [Marinilactibacillus kalidii]